MPNKVAKGSRVAATESRAGNLTLLPFNPSDACSRRIDTVFLVAEATKNEVKSVSDHDGVRTL